MEKRTGGGAYCGTIILGAGQVAISGEQTTRQSEKVAWGCKKEEKKRAVIAGSNSKKGS